MKSLAVFRSSAKKTLFRTSDTQSQRRTRTATLQAPVVVSLPAALAAELAELGAERLPRLSPQHRAALLASLSRAGVRPACAADAFAPLPLEVSVAIASLLPVGERLLLSLLSRAFRGLVAEPGLWRVVDLSPSSGVARVTTGLLRAVVAAARGAIEDLDVSGQSDANGQPLSNQAVRVAVAANALSLRRLNMRCKDGVITSLASVSKTLATAGPQLQSLNADVVCTAAQAGPLLKGEAPYGPLRVHRLKVEAPWSGEASVLTLARDVAGYASLEELIVGDAPLQAVAAATAVVDAAIARRLTSLWLVRCSLTPASVPALARLCAPTSCILKLVVSNGNVPFLDAATAPAFCAALRSSKLTELWLNNVGLWGTPAVGMAVVVALVAHPSIASLRLGGNHVDDTSHAGSLAMLLAANTPALKELEVTHCALGNSGLRSLVQALRGCTYLRSFVCSRNAVTRAFARDELLPAVTANASLRTLTADGNPSVPELAQAEALVAARLRTA